MLQLTPFDALPSVDVSHHTVLSWFLCRNIVRSQISSFRILVLMLVPAFGDRMIPNEVRSERWDFEPCHMARSSVRYIPG